MITDAFDPGPTGTFHDLCQSYPDDTVFRGEDGFRSLWGPIFYRGRADGTARLLVIGQDPAQTEAVTRRILCGPAGRRVQGFVEKLGFTTSYLMVNAFLYGVYNQALALDHVNDGDIKAYRNTWLQAAFETGTIEAVVAFGNPAFKAWTTFTETPEGKDLVPETIAFHRALHPTADKPEGPITTEDLLDNWNVALESLHPKISNPDAPTDLVPYRTEFTPTDLPPIPAQDLPMGLPAWMRTSTDFWASLPQSTLGTERANIDIRVP